MDTFQWPKKGKFEWATRLKKQEDFVDEIDALTERKINSMRIRAKNPSLVKKLDEAINFIKKKRMKNSPNKLFS